MRRLGLLPVVLATGCFLDAVATGDGGGDTGGATTVGPSSGGGGETSGGGGQAAGGEAQGGNAGPGGGGMGGGAGGEPCPTGYILLDGDDRAEAPSNVAFDDTDEFTFGARIRLDQVPTFSPNDGNYDEAYPFERFQPGDPGIGYWIGIGEDWDGDGDDGQPHFRVTISGPNLYCEAEQETVLSLGTWYRVAGSFDTNDVLTLYVDGVAVDSEYCGASGLPPFDGPIAVGSAGPAGITGGVDDVFIHGDANMIPSSSPIACNGGMLVAFPFDDGSLATACGGTHEMDFLDEPNMPVHACD